MLAPTPLHGVRVPRDRFPANVQTITAAALGERRSLDLAAFMNEGLGSVHVNDVQSNPLQPDLQYRGFLASPLLGAPQGLAVYLDGVRLNEPFGDTINWDLLPANAIRSVNLMPGSNPIFGLNTLGGALSIETKTGFSDPGSAGSVFYGSFGRKLVRANAGAHGERFGGFASVQLFDEDGWRALSPSRALSGLAALTYLDGGATADLIFLGAATSLTGNGPVPEQLLERDRAAVFTYPDRTENRAFKALGRGERPLGTRWRLSGAAYFHESRSRAANGDQRDWVACDAAPTALCSGDPGGAQTAVVDPAGNAVPFSADDDAANNTSSTRQDGYGASGQLSSDAPVAGHENHLYLGAAADQARVTFRSQSTVAHLGLDRGIADTGLLDPKSPVAVDTTTSTLGAYAGDTWALRSDLFITGSARFNVSWLSLQDRVGDALTGTHGFSRLNPAIGLSYQPRPQVGGYVGYSESNRTPTPVELTCASPTDPCRLPNGFVADPALAPVVAHTLEAGVRGAWRSVGRRVALDYAVAAFRTTNTDDILFISSGAVANQGYFANVGETRRQGLEASLAGHADFGRSGGDDGARVTWTLHYTLMNATFETPFTALSAAHPDAINGAIAVAAHARLPGVPSHIARASLGWTSRRGFSVGVDLVAQSGQFLRGDEANRLAPLSGYAVVNGRVAYQLSEPFTVVALVNNLLDARYATFGVLGDATAVLGSDFRSPRFVGPGAPRGVWLGIEYHR